MDDDDYRLFDLVWDWHDMHRAKCCDPLVEGPFCAASLAWAHEQLEQETPT